MPNPDKQNARRNPEKPDGMRQELFDAMIDQTRRAGDTERAGALHREKVAQQADDITARMTARAVRDADFLGMEEQDRQSRRPERAAALARAHAIFGKRSKMQ